MSRGVSFSLSLSRLSLFGRDRFDCFAVSLLAGLVFYVVPPRPPHNVGSSPLPAGLYGLSSLLKEAGVDAGGGVSGGGAFNA